MPKHSVIYIPGLNDEQVRGQRLALKLWRLQGVQPYLIQMFWAHDEPFRVKLDRIVRLIDRLAEKGDAVSLVAASAGASAAITAYAARSDKVRGVALICGTLGGADTISSRTYQSNPAFQTAMNDLSARLAGLTPEERERILSLAPLSDPVVPPAHTTVEGGHHRIMKVNGHQAGIAYGLTVASPGILRFLRASHPVIRQN